MRCHLPTVAQALVLLLASCTFNAEIAVDAPAEGSSGSSGPGHTSAADVTGLGATSLDTTSLDTTGSSDESDGTTAGTGSSGSSGDGMDSTGDLSECDGTIGIVDHRCTCTLDASGEQRAVDPELCDCALDISPEATVCLCGDEPQILATCGWACGSTNGEHCRCGEIDAPAQWCNLPPPVCEGDVEIDTGASAERCVCKSHFGLPSEPLDPALCGCAVAPDGCTCDGISYDPWVCNWPCTTQPDLSCLCGREPAPVKACALP